MNQLTKLNSVLALNVIQNEQDSHEPNASLKRTSVSTETYEVSDMQLWQEFQLGNENAYATIYKNNVSLLYNYGIKIVNNEPLVKDCIQDLFVEIWNKKDSLSSVKFIKSYLYTAIRRKLIAESRKVKHNYNLNIKEVSSDLTSTSIEHKLIEKQNFDEHSTMLNNALSRLTNKQKEAIYLKFNAQLSYEEISQVMSLTKKGCYKLIDRAIKGLRKQMK
ncbi:sigma-70 family RNA polymerase sigma factor [Flavobacteriaceae bacterium MHTCC 0001]